MRRTQAAVERDVYEWNLFSLLATKPRSDRPNQTANRQRNNQQIVHNRPCGCRRFFLACSQLKPEHKKRSKISFDVISIHERAKAFQWSRGGLLAKCLRKWRKFFWGRSIGQLPLADIILTTPPDRLIVSRRARKFVRQRRVACTSWHFYCPTRRWHVGGETWKIYRRFIEGDLSMVYRFYFE